MPPRPKSICRKMGCSTLIDSPGYCVDHKAEDVNNLRSLDSKKTPESKKFYSSSAWTRTSLSHRRREPLCARCLAKGITKAAQLVHHNPPLEELMAKGLNPCSDQYLESLCFNCHQGELVFKRKGRQ